MAGVGHCGGTVVGIQVVHTRHMALWLTLMRALRSTQVVFGAVSLATFTYGSDFYYINTVEVRPLSCLLAKSRATMHYPWVIPNLTRPLASARWQLLLWPWHYDLLRQYDTMVTNSWTRPGDNDFYVEESYLDCTFKSIIAMILLALESEKVWKLSHQWLKLLLCPPCFTQHLSDWHPWENQKSGRPIRNLC